MKYLFIILCFSILSCKEKVKERVPYKVTFDQLYEAEKAHLEMLRKKGTLDSIIWINLRAFTDSGYRYGYDTPRIYYPQENK